MAHFEIDSALLILLSLPMFFKGIDKNIFFLSLKKNDLIKCEYHYMTLTEKEQMIIYYSEDQHHECNIQK